MIAIAERIDEHERRWQASQPKVCFSFFFVFCSFDPLQPKPAAAAADRSRNPFLTGIGQMLFFIAALVAIAVGLWWREDAADETRICKFCGGQVKGDISRILSLTDAQALEEKLGGATYEVGSCTSCKKTQNIRHLAFNRYNLRRCDYCNYYTALRSEHFVVDDPAQVCFELSFFSLFFFFSHFAHHSIPETYSSNFS